MNPLSLSTISEMSGSRLLAGNPDAEALRVCKDTRTLKTGDLYIALRGEHFDGNRFIAEAASKGAVAALCDSEPPLGLPAEFGILGTADALTGLTLLAAAWRSRLNLRSVVITGSSGKTSVKDFTAAVLGSRLRTTATLGNLNNQIGLPLSILEANREDEAAVWEIGMNHRGEIAPLAGLAKPEIGIITGIGTAHIEFLGSREEIAREKGDLLERLPDSGAAIIPAEDPFSGELRGRTRARVLGIGFEHGDLRATLIRQEKEGSRFVINGEFGTAEATLPVPGRHMIGNALLAVGAGLLNGISLDDCVQALSKVSLTSGRLQRVVKRGVNILDDTYNANPDSMVAALETIGSMPASGRKIAVLGRMGELGIHASEGYQRVGERAAQGLDMLICVGNEAEGIATAATGKGMKDVRTVSGNPEAAKLLSSLCKEGDLVLLKASRSAHLEEILHRFI
jgi:UDP-N-acetylmuramoyl-tripeptide--D-alanyl-D-alanine ligase